MSKKKVGMFLGAVLLVAATAAGIWYYTENVMKDSKDRVYVEKVSTIMGSATGVWNRFSGVVEPQKMVEVNADAERTVSEVLVEVGDKVKKGEPLFHYDAEDIAMDLEQAKLEIENIDIEISGYKKQISELETEKKSAAEADKFEYTTQIQSVEMQVKQAEYDKSNKQLEIEKLEKKIEESEVLSPSKGVVKSINDPEGYDDMGDSSAFITILSTGDYKVKGSVNEQNIDMIYEEAPVIVRSRVDEEIIWNGTIESIDVGAPSESSNNEYMDYEGESTASSTDYPFYVTLEDADGLMLGQHVLIELDQGQTEEKEGLWLYSSYIIQDGELIYVWADDGNNHLIKKNIELGEYDEELDQYEIKSGLTEDDKIAWPMDGLYEGVVTVTDMEEIDYTSDLYNQGGTEISFGGTEFMGEEYLNEMEYFEGTEYWDEEEYLEDTEYEEEEEVEETETEDETETEEETETETESEETGLNLDEPYEVRYVLDAEVSE
ncbi:MAG: efflux RND transporter periplasmic adaptor subunit [Lachnospiraceae bacterium]|nr:efflux RND transporter periplasmic adaptor subunit [Lachnospiraceae bacterium]